MSSATVATAPFRLGELAALADIRGRLDRWMEWNGSRLIVEDLQDIQGARRTLSRILHAIELADYGERWKRRR